jgi:hypothetical protein
MGGPSKRAKSLVTLLTPPELPASVNSFMRAPIGRVEKFKNAKSLLGAIGRPQRCRAQ